MAVGSGVGTANTAGVTAGGGGDGVTGTAAGRVAGGVRGMITRVGVTAGVAVGVGVPRQAASRTTISTPRMRAAITRAPLYPPSPAKNSARGSVCWVEAFMSRTTTVPC